MLRNTTFNLPDELLSRAKAYAASHGTTMTAIVRAHLEAITSGDVEPESADPLLAFSQGRISTRDALRLTGLRDRAELLLALGESDLPMPMPPSHELENQATSFVKLWERG